MNKLELLLHLEELNIKRIVMEFSGSGDSGEINQRYYYTSLKVDTEIVNPERINYDAKDHIDTIVYEALELIEDWYNNDGGGGIITIYIPSMKYEIANYIYFTEQENYEHEGELKFQEN